MYETVQKIKKSFQELLASILIFQFFYINPLYKSEGQAYDAPPTTIDIIKMQTYLVIYLRSLYEDYKIFTEIIL